jgi:hypothetical protein
MSADPAALQAYIAQQQAEAGLVNRIARHGVEAPGVIRSLSPTGRSDLGGGREVEGTVTITPADGAPFDAHVMQHVMAEAVATLTAGRAVTAKSARSAWRAA